MLASYFEKSDAQDREIEALFREMSAVAKQAIKELRVAKLRIVKLTAELDECSEYFQQRADCDQEWDGPIPNEEMQMLTSIDECLHGPGNW